MRLLLDESMDVRLRHMFVGHEVRTVRYMGWDSIGITMWRFWSHTSRPLYYFGGRIR